jgi:hypothetical protein
MSEKAWNDWTPEEFEALLDRFSERDDDDIPLSTFFATLAAIDRERREQVIELEWEVVAGELSLTGPPSAPLPVTVTGNEIVVDPHLRIALRPRQCQAASRPVS